MSVPKGKRNKSKVDFDAMNCYLSWRESMRITCNACYGTIETMDKLFKTLFPHPPKYKRRKRDEVINETFKEADYEDLRHQR